MSLMWGNVTRGAIHDVLKESDNVESDEDSSDDGAYGPVGHGHMEEGRVGNESA